MRGQWRYGRVRGEQSLQLPGCRLPPSGRRYATASGDLGGECVSATELDGAVGTGSDRSDALDDGGSTASYLAPYTCDDATVALYHFDNNDGRDSCGSNNELKTDGSWRIRTPPGDAFVDALRVAKADVYETIEVAGTELDIGRRLHPGRLGICR